MKEAISKKDQKSLAIWAADCAERVLPFFEDAYPKEDRPRKAINACRKWVRTGLFRMQDIRKASLDAHAAARSTDNLAARFAARAAGQAVATAHVPQHAYGPAYYALKVVEAVNPDDAEAEIAKEFRWQLRHLPRHMRKEWMDWQNRRLPKRFLRVLGKVNGRKSVAERNKKRGD